MLASSLLIFASAASALASPVEYHGRSSSCEPGKPVPVLPVNGGPSELPAPPRGVTLKHIALGFGIQNYSCAGAGATPAAVGALAVLYDVTCLYPGQARSSLKAKKWASLPSDVLNTRKVPLNRNDDGASPTLVPTFDLDKANQLLIAKIDGIKAPASAPVGPEGTGAVDWLYLGDAGGSQGVSFVYRVLTAGGASHGCKAKGTDSTSYTTFYWFYA
ncbi:hypothetical protein ACKAV7_003660 [Fusarium commune]